ncbi:CLUMA_CG010967, isoform A [Clunio marinus]|uniref:Mitochondrial proton/calcium exchanger protein n=1 Tax=Clunio marinus TaxID=568069 RepID=A0A1J1IBC3_9DIPT|nr:CLUMA_CG010967, isoform A [Clunio marinus]
MNAFINQQKVILRLRKNRRLVNLNNPTLIRNSKYYSVSTTQPQLRFPVTANIQNRLCTRRSLLCDPNVSRLLSANALEYTISRNICSTFQLMEKSSSKVEDVVKSLKSAEKEKTEQKPTPAVTSAAVSPPETVTTAEPSEQLAKIAPETAVATTPVKKSLRARIWAELVHYYHGFRLLFIDINICRKYLWKVLNGQSLSRREHRLVVRTTSDLFRLVPFSVFIIVPFMELLLPVAIKLFPGMLPSTFQSASDQDNKIKQSLKVKIEMAKFLQKTLDDMTVQHKDHRSEAAKEFSVFFQNLRTSGGYASNEEIIKFSQLFEDEITLDSLSRQQLLALCRVLEANTIGTSNLLRFQLRMKLRSLAADDRLIQKEGIDTLNLSELQSACRARGMRAYGLSEERLRVQLQEWINLSLNEKVPPSLLLLSRALMLPEDVEVSEKLKATLASLPETVGTQAKAAIGEREGKIDNKTKIEIIKEEQRKIQEELDEEKEAELEKAQKLKDAAPVIATDPSREQISQMFMEQKVMEQEEKLFIENAIPVEKELSSEDLKVLSDALGTIGKEKKNLILEKEEIKEIKEEIAEYQEDVQELEQIVELQKDEKTQLKESRAAKNLFKKVNSMINKLDLVLDDLEKKEKEIKILIEEPVKDEAEETLVEEDAKRAAELVRIDEMMNAIRKIQKVSDESVLEKIQQILGRIDDDQDGSLKVEDVLKVIETIGKENVQLNPKQVNEILDLMDKEEIIETEDKIEKALKKELEQKQLAKEQKKKEDEDFTESEAKFILEDKAKELEPETKNSDADEIDPKIKKVVENQSEQILSQIPPIQSPTSTGKSQTTSNGSPKPKDKVI